MRLRDFFSVIIITGTLLTFFALGHAQTLGGGGGVSQAQLNAVIASIPISTSTVPTAPSGVGTLGTAGTYTPPDAAQKITVQRTTVTSDTSGNWTVTWNNSFVSSSPTINPIPLNPSGTQPIVCNVKTRSQTQATGFCWLAGTVTIAALGSNVNIFQNGAPTAPVMVIGAEPTQ